jgi:hypothetical protein
MRELYPMVEYLIVGTTVSDFVGSVSAGRRFGKIIIGAVAVSITVVPS